ncbi:hypothetical protein PRZ48_003066 [Zasmidium cellare]|uniref:DUF6590 domain-containing protein n=1 Tax=Zasmidium cellare TaxID=395010 RepID=A0ABR0EW86_ZASCE|nr:hypothetical protein PRZ48_003066 [Zasmidium cellare]
MSRKRAGNFNDEVTEASAETAAFSHVPTTTKRRAAPFDDSTAPAPKRCRQESNWGCEPSPLRRGPPPRPQGPPPFRRERSLRQTVLSARTPKSGINTAPRLQDIESLFPGVIIRAAHYETAQDPNANPLVNNSFVFSAHSTICAKKRYMVVLWVYSNGCILALPVSSHQGQDLVNLSNKKLNFYMLIGTEEAVDRENETGNEPLIIQKMYRIDGTDKRYALNNTSSICLSTPYTVQYNESMEVVGCLDEPSTNAMTEKYDELKDEAVKRSREAEKKYFQKT